MPWSSVRIPWMTPAITKTIARGAEQRPDVLAVEVERLVDHAADGQM